MSVTIHDVARLAGVSHTTVSWAIHDSPNISAATKEKVYKAIEELNYHPNYSARSLVNGKTGTIAVVANFFSSYFEMEILKGIEQGLRSRKTNYSINLFSTLEQHEKTLSNIIYEKRADAVILLSISPSPKICELYKTSEIPLIVIDESAPDAVVMSLNNFEGAYKATELLINSGKHNFGLVLGDDEELGLSQYERKRGFIQALTDHNIDFDESHIFSISDYYFEEGQIIFKRMERIAPDINAIFCAAGDIVATGIMLEAKKSNKRIPDDLAIIGYDDYISSAITSPSLSTVRQPLSQVGKDAYLSILKLLNKEELDPNQLCYSPMVIRREST